VRGSLSGPSKMLQWIAPYKRTHRCFAAIKVWDMWCCKRHQSLTGAMSDVVRPPPPIPPKRPSKRLGSNGRGSKGSKAKGAEAAAWPANAASRRMTSLGVVGRKTLRRVLHAWSPGGGTRSRVAATGVEKKNDASPSEATGMKGHDNGTCTAWGYPLSQ
jgi:hypothetical protein